MDSKVQISIKYIEAGTYRVVDSPPRVPSGFYINLFNYNLLSRNVYCATLINLWLYIRAMLAVCVGLLAYALVYACISKENTLVVGYILFAI